MTNSQQTYTAADALEVMGAPPADIKRASSPGFWEMWIGGRFVGMYYTRERAMQASRSWYAVACHRGNYRGDVRSIRTGIES